MKVESELQRELPLTFKDILLLFFLVNVDIDKINIRTSSLIFIKMACGLNTWGRLRIILPFFLNFEQQLEIHCLEKKYVLPEN